MAEALNHRVDRLRITSSSNQRKCAHRCSSHAPMPMFQKRCHQGNRGTLQELQVLRHYMHRCFQIFHIMLVLAQYLPCEKSEQMLIIRVLVAQIDLSAITTTTVTTMMAMSNKLPSAAG